MAVTLYYSFPKFTIGGDNNAWGQKYNAALDGIDLELHERLPLSGGTMEGLLLLAGSSSDGEPSLAFADDDDTGLGLIDIGRLGLQVNGATIIEVDQNGAIGTLQGRADTEIVHRLDPYEDDSNNGGLDVLTRSSGTLAQRHRIGEKIGLGRNDPKQLLDYNGSSCANLVDLASGVDIDVRQGNHFKKTISANAVFTVSNVPTSRISWFTLKLTNGGAYTVTWPASFKWPLGVPPSLTAAGVDILGFITYDDGTTWNGVLSQKTSS